MSKFLAVAVIFAAGAAQGDIMHSFVQQVNTGADAEIPGFSTTYQTWDLIVTVTDTDDPPPAIPDDWTSTAATATTDGVWFDHIMDDTGGTGNGVTDNPPNPAFFPAFPALEFDSFYAAGLWNAPGYATLPTTVGGVKNATWFDSVDSGNGTYVIARYTFGISDYFTIAGTSTAKNTGGELFPFNFVVPAPGSIALLGLGALVARRRR
ncbi:MAG: PEP-CTERM sorting domain-containing protein [Phycisphaerales bacterium]|nr:PEP-CTERM sorting domain-containing protein [Phycisphaerales bacterium]